MHTSKSPAFSNLPSNSSILLSKRNGTSYNCDQYVLKRLIDLGINYLGALESIFLRIGKSSGFLPGKD